MGNKRKEGISVKGVISAIYQKLLPQSKYQDYLRKQGMVIGTGCSINKGADFGSEPYLVTIGDHVRINAGVCVVTHDGGMWVLRSEKAGFGSRFRDADRFGRVVIGDNVHIGTNTILMPGVTIGCNAIVGCGAVVTHDVESNTVVAGVPARFIETLQEYAKKQEGRYVNTKHMTFEEKRNYLKNVGQNVRKPDIT